MKNRYRLLFRGDRNMYFCFDTETNKRTSLHTNDRDAATQIVLARNQALRQPALNLQIAKAYLSGTDQAANTRTWSQAIIALTGTKHGENKDRWERAAKDPAFASLLPLVIVETKGETLLNVMKTGTVSTNVFLRRLHNFCVDMNWLPWPLIPKRQWPAVKHKDKRAITLEEHQKIIAAEVNPQRRAYYELCWQLGGSQGDVAKLRGEDVDWENGTIGLFRRKNEAPAIIHLGTDVLDLLKDLASEGPIFPNLAKVRASDRATEFRSRCRQLGIEGITLHSYRYAWAERAKVAGMPERFAMENLGHNSKAVHRAYARRALIKIPSLQEYEQRAANLKASAT